MQTVWDNQGTLYSIGDDNRIVQWNHDHTLHHEVTKLNYHTTCLDIRVRNGKITYVIGTSEGKIKKSKQYFWGRSEIFFEISFLFWIA